MHYQSYTLSNGLRIIHQPFSSNISYCGIVVNAGSRDEYPDEIGLAHFVEHMLFKGTEHRRAYHIANRMESVGGEMNAYTTKEETYIYSTFLEPYFARAVELLSDVVFHSEFRQHEIERERDVVLDEINSYIDTPSEQIYDDFENLVFDGNELGHYILGTPKSVSSFDSETVKQFVNRQYRPDRMVFFSFGSTPFAKVARLVEKYFSQSFEALPFKERIKPTKNIPIRKIINKKSAQAHTIIGRQTIDMFDSRCYAFYLLNHILSGGMSSRLNNSLREKNGLVYQVESNVTFYTDTGIFYIYFACDSKDIERCIDLIDKEFTRIHQRPITEKQLLLAKRQLKGQWGISSENHENVALAMAKSFLHFNDYLSFEEMLEKIDAVSSIEIQTLVDEFLDISEMSQLNYSSHFRSK
ncbi:MAG TPA: pitrilysin family protein [Dysgonamonadaceae bacterium]|nr:pitrilysin family protein [Dysgonamonadaceae bacterium]